MTDNCGCGAPATRTDSKTGICTDCYKSLSTEERKRWIERKLRGVENKLTR